MSFSKLSWEILLYSTFSQQTICFFTVFTFIFLYSEIRKRAQSLGLGAGNSSFHELHLLGQRRWDIASSVRMKGRAACFQSYQKRIICLFWCVCKQVRLLSSFGLVYFGLILFFKEIMFLKTIVNFVEDAKSKIQSLLWDLDKYT